MPNAGNLCKIPLFIFQTVSDILSLCKILNIIYLYPTMTQKIVFKRGNLVGDGHPLPAVAEVPLSLICSIPASIVLLVDEHGINDFLSSKLQVVKFYFQYILIYTF